MRVRWLVIFWRAYRLWLRSDCIDLSAAFAYHTLQSIFPALLIGLSLTSRWLGGNSLALGRLLHLLGQVIPDSTKPVLAETLTRFLQQGLGAGVLGFLLFLFAANNIYLSLQRGADRLWWNRPFDHAHLDLPQLVVRFILLRIKAFVLLLLIGPLLIVDQWVSSFRSLGFGFVRAFVDPLLPALLQTGGSVSFGLDMLISLLIATLVTLLLLWWLPSRRIPMGPLLPAALFTACLITGLNLLLGRSLVQLGLRYQAYGVVGGFLLFSLWVWLVGVLLYYGHCLAVVLAGPSWGRRSAQTLSP